MTEGLTRWEKTRLSKHFILLDFMADRAVYRSGMPLAFDRTWDKQHALAKGLCEDLLEPLMAICGPISVADAFWPASIAEKTWPRELQMGHHQADASRPDKHRWAGGEATVDIAPYRLVDHYKKMGDENKRGNSLKNAVKDLMTTRSHSDRIISYRNSEFLCVTFKENDANICASYDRCKKQSLRAHHVRVGRFFNLLDFCRSGRAVEQGIDLVPKGAENNGGRDYIPVREEAAARSFAAALDPMVEQLGRISVVRGIETEVFQARFPDTGHAKLHRWDREDGPWRLVFVLPKGANPETACSLLRNYPHVHQDVRSFPHASGSNAVALVVDRKDYDEYRGLRPAYAPSGQESPEHQARSCARFTGLR